MNKLTFEKGQELAGAIQQRAELREQKIQSRETEATIRGLDKLISNTLAEHAEHLVGCWFVVETEYDPLVAGFASLLRRGQAINAARLGSQLAQQKQHEAELAKLPQEPESKVETPLTPPNVVPLDAAGHGILVAPDIK